MHQILALLDPSMSDYDGAPSRNLGDLIIFEAVNRVLAEILPTTVVERFCSQKVFREQDCERINTADVVILGGTNALSSHRGGHTWYWDQTGMFFLFPKIRRNILLGVGWGTGYPMPPSRRMKLFYRRILSRHNLHSVRDQFTCDQLKRIGIRNVVNTGCPTTWQLNGLKNRKTSNKENCLFTLTDYAKDLKFDNQLIQCLAESVPGRLIFFPQGDEDLDYIRALAAFERHRHRIDILERDFDQLKTFVSERDDVFYVGTRLHCGIFCLQHDWDALILEVDNRAGEMGRDFRLPVVHRTSVNEIASWIKGQLDLGTIQLPMENISLWKKQFQRP